MTLKNIVLGGAFVLIVLGVWHAVHVGRASDVEPYLWVVSVFLFIQGLLTIALIRRDRPKQFCIRGREA